MLKCIDDFSCVTLAQFNHDVEARCTAKVGLAAKPCHFVELMHDT